jgi:hypothetical protein
VKIPPQAWPTPAAGAPIDPIARPDMMDEHCHGAMTQTSFHEHLPRWRTVLVAVFSIA